jgi:hypothetical protein
MTLEAGKPYTVNDGVNNMVKGMANRLVKRFLGMNGGSWM